MTQSSNRARELLSIADRRFPNAALPSEGEPNMGCTATLANPTHENRIRLSSLTWNGDPLYWQPSPW